MDIAQEFIQQRGYNAFSYSDIAGEIGIKTASIHYHFPSKADLGKNLLERYNEEFVKQTGAIDEKESSAVNRLKAYLDLNLELLDDQKMCLAGAFASDIFTIPEELQIKVREFVSLNESWLAKTFREGRNASEIKLEGNVEIRARSFFSTVQGAMLIAKAMKSEERFLTISQDLLNGLVLRS